MLDEVIALKARLDTAWSAIAEQAAITKPYPDDAAAPLRSSWVGWTLAHDDLVAAYSEIVGEPLDEARYPVDYDGVSPLPFEGGGAQPQRLAEIRGTYRQQLIVNQWFPVLIARIAAARAALQS